MNVKLASEIDVQIYYLNIVLCEVHAHEMNFNNRLEDIACRIDHLLISLSFIFTKSPRVSKCSEIG